MKTSTAKKRATGQPEAKLVKISFEEFEELHLMNMALMDTKRLLKAGVGRFVEADGLLYTLSLVIEKLDSL